MKTRHSQKIHVWTFGLSILFAALLFNNLPQRVQQTETPTPILVDGIPITLTPSITPTLGTWLSRTPSPAQRCPTASGQSAKLTMPANKFFDKQYRFAPEPILGYLNATGSVRGLKEALQKLDYFIRISILSADVTGDHVPEVLLDLKLKGFAEVVFVVLGCHDGQYAVLYNHIALDYAEPFYPEPTGIQAIQDMNGNGTPDIVYDYLPNVGAHGYGFFSYQILEWDGSHFVDLAEQEHDPIGGVYSKVTKPDPLPSIIRAHGNGTYELAVQARPGKDSYYGGSDAERRREIIYAWNGLVFAHYCTRFIEPPKYLADAVMDGDNESACRHFDAAQRAYQQAIFNPNLLPWNNLADESNSGCCVNFPTLVPDPNERPRLEAYARYRIIVLHAAQNQPQEAATDLSILVQKTANKGIGAEFAALAQAFMDSYQQAHNVKVGCQAAIQFAQGHPTIAASFDHYLFTSQGVDIHAFGLSDALQQICPFT